MYRVILTICFIAFGIEAEKCLPIKCSSDISIYNSGSAFTYKFESIYKIQTTPENSNDSEQTDGKVSGNAKIYSNGNCNFVLQLEDVNVISPKENYKKAIIGQEIPVSFGLNSNGEIEHQICADTSDNDFALNLKRSIISMFSTGDSKVETDVFGVCQVEKNVMQGKLITRKDLSKCAYRENFGLIKSVLDKHSYVKSSTLLHGSYYRESELRDNKILNNVKINEEYKLGEKGRPLVSIKINTSLKFDKSEDASSPKVINAKTTSIIFESPRDQESKNGDVLKKQFTKTLETFDEFVKFGASENFIELLRLMRHATTDSLMDMNKLASTGLSRKIYLDALFRTGTSKSISAIIRQLPKMSEQEKKIAFISLYLVNDVTKENLNQVANLVSLSGPKEAYLALGHLVSRFCSKSIETCDGALTHVTKKYVESLKKCRNLNKLEEDRVIFTLKGVQNSYNIAQLMVSNIIQCVNVGSNRVRVAAIQAISTSSCNPQFKEKILNLLKNLNEDSEIRIESYLAAVNCPSNDLAIQLEKIVNNEPINQVGNFISSHLRALRESTDRSKETQKYYLANIRVTKKFESDWRRFSFASENSFLFESIGLGASTASNLIYGLEGYLPRSIRWNVSAELFGNEINVWDLSMRQENMENIINGILSEDPKHRLKRGLKEESEKFSKKYKSQNNDMSLDISLKFFGSEMFFLSLDNLDALDFKNVLKEHAKERKIESHTLFLDSKISYPTSLGFPLVISAHGMATNKILFDFKDTENIWDLKFIPSFDATINAMLSLDFQNFKNGLRVSSTLHSSTGFDAELNVNKDLKENVSSVISNMNTLVGNWTNNIVKRSAESKSNEKFSLTLNIPQATSNILKFKHSISFIHSENDKEEKVTNLRQKKKRSSQEQCFEQLLIVGAKVCYQTDFTDFDYADFSLTLNLEKKITFIGSHIIDGNKQSFVLTYDTPESKNQHTTKITTSFALVPEPFLQFEIEFSNINKLLALEVGLKNNEHETALYLKHSDDSQMNTYKAGLSKSKNEYYPVLECVSNDHKISSIGGYSVTGKIIVNGNEYSLDNIGLITPSNDKTTLNGKVSIEKDKYAINLKLNNNVSIQSNLDLSGDPGYRIELYIDENGGQIFFAPGEVELRTKIFENDVTFKGKHDKEKIDINFNWLKNNKKEVEIILNGKKTSNSLEGIFSAETHKEKTLGINFKIENNQEIAVKVYFNRHFLEVNGKREANQVSGQFKSSSGAEVVFQGNIGNKWAINEHLIDVHGKVKFSSENLENVFHLKSSVDNDHHLSEFKVSRENINWIIWTSDINVFVDKPISGKCTLEVKDLLRTIVSFKFNHKNGKGDVSANFKLKDHPENIKWDTKFQALLPKIDFDTTILIANDRKLSLKSESVFDKMKLSSKNIILFDKKDNEIKIDIKGSSKNDEMLGEIDLLAFNKNINGKFIRKNNKNGAIIDISVKEQNNVLDFNVKFENSLKNFKIKTNVALEKMKLEAFLQKNDNIYSYNIETDNLKTFAKLSLTDITFKFNDIQIDGKKNNNILSLDVKNANFYINSKIDTNDNKIVFEQESSIEKLRSLSITFERKDNKKSAYFIINDNKYAVELINYEKNMELLLQTPTKTSKIHVYGDIRSNERSGAWTLEIIDLFNFSGKHTGSFNLEDMKNLHIASSFETKNKVIFMIELASQGEKFNININIENKNFLKGSLNYAIKEEAHKSYIEGQGQLLVGEKTTQANFKVMRQVFKADIDKESGVKFSFTGNFDDRTTINFIKITDRELHGKFCLCDDKKECANVELESRENKVLAIIDLKTFGIPYEFDLKSHINQDKLDFDARLIDSNNKDIYKTSSSISAKSQKILLKIHSKELSLQADLKMPENGIFGYYEENIVFGFDKNEKSRILWTAEVMENSIRTSCEFIHPKMKTLSINSEFGGNLKDFSLYGKLTMDVFDNIDKKIFLSINIENINNVVAVLESKGLDINNKLFIQNLKTPLSKLSISFENNEQKTFIIKTNSGTDNSLINFDLLDSKILTIILNAKTGFWTAEVKLLGHQYLLSLESNEKYKKALLQLKGLAEIETFYSPKNKMSLRLSESGGSIYGGIVSLEKGTFLETKSEGTQENLNKIMFTVKEEYKRQVNKVYNNIETTYKTMRDGIKVKQNMILISMPDLTSIKSYYGKHLDEILLEVEHDFGPIKNILKSYKEGIIFVFDRLKHLYSDISQMLTNLQSIAEKILVDSVLPTTKAILNSIEELFDVIFSLIYKQIQSINISQYIHIAAPSLEIITDFISNTMQEIIELYKDYNKMFDNIPSLDDVVKRSHEIFSEYKLSDQLLELINSMLLQIKSLYPESSEFCDKLFSYLKRKLSGNLQISDDIQIVKEFIDFLRKNIPNDNISIENLIPNMDFGFLPTISFSIFKLLDNLPTLHNLQLTGHTLPNGGFISFDGKFSIYSKSCKLILAQDSVDANFTIFGNFKNGQLKSLALVDKKRNYEIIDNGLVKMNGKNVEWPLISSGNVVGTKNWQTIKLNSNQEDVKISCSINLKNCVIIISYKYTGKIRGILGNGNGEKYDDFILPDGTITDSESSFFSAYGIGSCESMSMAGQSLSQKQSCLNLFKWDSTMSLGYSFISTDAFEKACDFISKCDVAAAYVRAVKTRNIPITMPTECLKCENKKEFGEEFPVKIPSNKADVVFIVDLDISSQVIHELVNPTIDGMQKDLKDRGFNDINIGIIGYTSNYADPIVITGNIESITIAQQKNAYLQKLINYFSPKADEKAFEIAMQYPFRALASKTIFVFRADGLVLNLGNIGRAITYSAASEIRGILLQVAQPILGLTEDVIGFNNKLALPLKGPKDAKKRLIIKYDPNVSIENVLHSGGWVFDIQKFNGLTNENDKRQYVHQLTSTVAENLFRTEITGNCKCLSYDGLSGYSACIVVKTVNTSKKNKSSVK